MIERWRDEWIMDEIEPAEIQAWDKARILYLTNRFPFPLTSGQLRHYFLIRELASRYNITLLSFVEPSYQDEHAEALIPFTDRILTIPIAQPLLKSWFPVRPIRSLVRSYKAVRQMRLTLKQLLQEGSYDIVISGKRTYLALVGLASPPLIADVCDASSLRVKRSIKYMRPSKWPRLIMRYVYTRFIEQQLMARAEHAFFISDHDRQVITRNDALQTTIVPNGVDLAYWRRSGYEQEPATIVFSGVMNYWPNTDAALYLIEEIFPLVRQAVPMARLFIVGRDPTSKLMVAARQQPGIIVTGFVDDVRPYLERAAVFAAPLRFGAGQQNKVLEALAMELPVVASPLAVEGLQTEDGSPPPIQVAEGRQEFARTLIVQLEQGPALNDAARCFLETHFVWSSSRARMEHVIDSVIHGVKT